MEATRLVDDSVPELTSLDGLATGFAFVGLLCVDGFGAGG